MAKGQTGGSLGGGQFLSKRRADARRRAAKRQDEAWAAKAGPTIIRIGDHEIYVKSQAKKDIAAARKVLLDAIAAGAPPGVVSSDDDGPSSSAAPA